MLLQWTQLKEKNKEGRGVYRLQLLTKQFKILKKKKERKKRILWKHR
jgi:hypothetical protein